MLMLPDSRIRLRDYLLEIARAITQELDLDKLLKRILQLSAEMLRGQAGLVALRGEDGRWMVSASHGLSPELHKYLDPLLAAVPDHEDPARFELPKINEILQTLTRQVSHGLLTGIGLPLTVRNKVIGVIFIFRNYSGSFTSDDLKLLGSFADQAAIAVQNALLYTQVSQEKQQIDALLDSVADGILIMKSNRVIVRVNPAFARLFGRPMDEIIGKTHDDVIRWSKLEHGMTLEEAEPPASASYME